jgi:hypothetical protein
MSKFSNREVIKNLSNLNVDCQYAYQVGLQVFSYNGQNPEEHKELCVNFKKVCDDIKVELESVTSLIPSE